MKDGAIATAPRSAGCVKLVVGLGLGLVFGALAGVFVGLLLGVGIALILGVL